MMLLTKGIPPQSRDFHRSLPVPIPPFGKHTHFSPLSAFCNYISAVSQLFAGWFVWFQLLSLSIVTFCCF